MKNTIKMSLVAALAVAGFSTTASAGSLEEAIKGVSISGKMEVEYDYTSTNTGRAGATDVTGDAWDYDLDLTAKIPVNDMVTAVVGLEADHGDNVENTVDGGIGGAGSNTDAAVDVSSLYFTYANGPVTTMIGKQGMAGAPWFHDEKANGVVGLYNAGVATVAAAHFTGLNALSGALNDRNIFAAAVIGSMGPVNAQLWYADISNVADSVVIEADATFDIVNLSVKYGTADYELAASGGLATVITTAQDEASMLQAIVSADLGVATPYFGYGATDDENGNGNTGLDLTGDTDSRIDFGSEQLSIDDLADADAFIIGVTVPMNEWKFDLSYVDGDYQITNTLEGDYNELLLDVEYKMSKNFTIDAFYSVAELDNDDDANGVADSDDMDAVSIALEYQF